VSGIAADLEWFDRPAQHPEQTKKLLIEEKLTPVPGSPHPGQTNPDQRSRRMGAKSHHPSRQSRLATHNCRRPN
jgi:hypothetical protein